eukprot:9465541-Alexandrium_andersonii.AAC.1
MLVRSVQLGLSRSTWRCYYGRLAVGKGGPSRQRLTGTPSEPPPRCRMGESTPTERLVRSLRGAT